MYYFDKQAANKAIGFIETFCTHTKGELSGTALILEDWQKKIVGDLFGWKNKKTNLRRYRTAYIQIARKNGKSTLAAALALLMLYVDDEKGSEVYSAASNRQQAGIVFEIAKGMIQNNKELNSRGKIFRNSIINEGKGNFYQAISSDSKTKHGFNSNCVVYDELHTAQNRELWDALATSVGSRRQPLIITITTAGFDRQSICYELYSYAKKILNKSLKDDSFYPCVFECDIDDDIQDEKVWKKANPNYGISLKKKYMKIESQKAMDVPSYLNTFKRLHLNMWTDSVSVWIPNNEWMECHQEFDYDSLDGCAAWGGLDLASTRDLSALTLVFKVEDKFVIMPYIFVPKENAIKRSKIDGVDYLTFIRENDVIATEGDVQDYSFIRKTINDLSKKYRIQSIAYDRWGASQLILDLTNQDGVPMSPLGQGFVSLSAPTKTFEREILAKNVIHPNNKCLNWCMSNVAIQEDASGNLKPAKNRSKEKIDPVVATICAFAEMMTMDSGESVYDERGLILL